MPGLLPRGRLEQLDLETTFLGPAHLHAQHHLGPILGVGATGAGVDRHERVAGVVATREQPLLLELLEAGLDARHLLDHLALERRVLLGHLGERAEILDVALQRTERLQLA